MVDAVRAAGDLYRRGRQEEASKAAVDALALLDQRRDPPDFDVASSLNDLGALLFAQGDSERAGQLFQRSRDAYSYLAGPGDTRLATILYNLAGIDVEKGRYAEAEPLYRNALAIRERTFGAAHPITAEVANALGYLMLQQKKLAEAEPLLERAAEAWRGAEGAEAFAAVALANLALLRWRQGKLIQAESLYRQAIEIEEKVFGAQHPEAAATLMSFAALQQARGAISQSVSTYQRALAIVEKSLGPADPLAMEIRGRLAESGGEYQILVVRTSDEAALLRKRLDAGDDFAALATAHSIDPNAPHGGFFSARPADLREDLRTKLAALQPGQISPVFPLGPAWAIVKKISDPAPPPK